MQSFKDFLNEEEINYIVIDIPQEFVDDLLLLHEGKWIDSGKNGYLMRIDKPTDHTQNLHVHIAKKNHINAKTKQVAWNDDGTRHDKKSFNQKLGGSSTVQNIARKALNLDDKFILETYVPTKLGLILEGIGLKEQLNREPDCRLTVTLSN